MAELYTKTSSGVERIDVSVPKIEERVTNLESNKLGKTEKAASSSIADRATIADTANLALSVSGENVTGAVANASSVPWSGVSGKPSFATVATSGNYNDLINKPEISNKRLGTYIGWVNFSNTHDSSSYVTTFDVYNIQNDGLMFIEWKNGAGAGSPPAMYLDNTLLYPQYGSQGPYYTICCPVYYGQKITLRSTSGQWRRFGAKGTIFIIGK